MTREGGDSHCARGITLVELLALLASHLLGDLNVCVATIPKAWQDMVSANDDGLRVKRK